MARPHFRLGIFVSYSHHDRDWLERLQIHLAPYLRDEKITGITLWSDKEIPAGSDWAEEIRQAIAKARVAVLLVTPDFLASKYATQVELPELLRRSKTDLTIMWIPIRPSAYEATPLRDLQAAYDPTHPLASLTRAKQDEALVAISKRIASAMDINAVGNAFRIIDDFEPQVKAFVTRQPEPDQSVVHSWRAEQVENTIKLVEPHGERALVTADDLEKKLDSDAQKLIRAYERTMKTLFERWTELKTKRVAEDPEIRHEACQQSNEVRIELCAELNGLLGFVESLGMELRDHYQHVRYICSQPM